MMMMMPKSALLLALTCAVAACVQGEFEVERVMLPGPFMPPHSGMGLPPPHPGMPEFTETIFRPGMAHPMTIHGYGHPPMPMPTGAFPMPVHLMHLTHPAHPMVTFHLLGHPPPMAMQPMGHPMMHALFFPPATANPLQFLSPEYHLMHAIPAAFQPPPPPGTHPTQQQPQHEDNEHHSFPHPFAVFGNTKGPFGNFFGKIAHDLAKPMAQVRRFERHAEDGLAQGFGHMLDGARRFEHKLARAVKSSEHDSDTSDEHTSSFSSSTVQEEATDNNGQVHGYVKKTRDIQEPGHAPVHTESVTPIGQSEVGGSDERDERDEREGNDHVDDEDDEDDDEGDDDEEEEEEPTRTTRATTNAATSATTSTTTTAAHAAPVAARVHKSTTTTKVVDDKAETEAAIARAVADIRAHNNHGKP